MVDRYTKAVLTVIALALVAIVTENVIQPSQAQMQAHDFRLCDGRNCATLVVVGKDGLSDIYGLGVAVHK
ncbi:hypothetical protein SAMN05444161_2943 [Rhizobiales bacterium GAS191]|nr:hypothetical protein SAMN05444161_2943 [Rhizobiales bacterium GAS191]